jgi:cytochrome b subunit of formate dehydrogenase/mono/diheme cytochrome c family protein
MSEKRYERFGLARRIEHAVLILSFTTLGCTGLIQKYAGSNISESIIQFLGGIETTRIIHRTAAVIFLLEAVYHLVVLGYKLYIQRAEASMMPGVKDVRDVIQFVGFNLGITKDHPKMGRFNFAEKAEYWAMIWGLIMMGLTGLMLWNPISTANFLPGQFIPAAKSAHGLEAVLAVLAIILWHFYNVHVKFWNWAMFKGSLSQTQMEEEHALELEAIQAGKKSEPVSGQERSKRMKVFVPVSAISTIVVVIIIYQFITFEKTAITTVPPALGGVPAYQRQTATPLPTKAPTATPAPKPTAAPQVTSAWGGSQIGGGSASATTWNGGVNQLFKDNCSACHGANALGGLNVLTYADLMKGGTDGAVIKTGSPDTSLLMQKMKGSHAKTFGDADLTTVSDWIKAGAPEK